MLCVERKEAILDMLFEKFEKVLRSGEIEDDIAMIRTTKRLVARKLHDKEDKDFALSVEDAMFFEWSNCY